MLVDFWAEWCQPCKTLTPVLEEAVKERDVMLVKVDVETNKALAREYDVAGIPAVKGFKDGRVVPSSSAQSHAPRSTPSSTS